MVVTFYKNLSDDRKIEKSIEEIEKTECTPYENIDILNNRILVEFNENLLNSNYCYNEMFNRFYFIKNIEITTAQMMIFSCEIDVLMSHSSLILQQNAVIKRNEQKANYYLNDSEYLVEERNLTVTKEFPLSPLTNQYNNFILKVVL